MGEPVFYVRIGLCNTKTLMDNMSHEQVLDYMVLNREKTLSYLHEQSLKERRLVKAISVLDFTGFSITRGSDSRFQKVDIQFIYITLIEY
jgi:hypothetical protein